MISGQFLQSKEWAKFQESLGRKTFWIDNALIIKMPLPLGLSYLYCPKTAYSLQLTAYSLMKEIKKIAKQERAVFLRVEPAEKPPANFIKTKDVQPKCTLMTDISKSESELLSAMHEKTRYNIRLAERKKLRITNYELRITGKGFNDFYGLLQKTSARQKIKLHSKEYYKKLLNHPDHNLCDRTSYGNELFIAYYKNTPVATAMVNFYKDTATYLHGGSDEKYKNLMAPNLLHWEIIKTAKLGGMQFYDWWGVDEKKWPGVTRFKRGFGGEELCVPGTFDLPLNKLWYALYKLLRK